MRRLAVRALISLLIVTPFLLHARGDMPIGALSRLENLAYDLRLRFTMPRSLGQGVVIVDIDERSLAGIGQWPWPRDRLATLVDQLFDRYGARVVGFDIAFAEPDASSGLPVLEAMGSGALRENPGFLAELERARPELDRDRRFAEALADRPTVLSLVFQPCPRASTAGSLPPPAVPAAAADTLDVAFVEPCGFTANLALLQGAAATGGFFDNPALDADGMFRRATLLQRYAGGLYESFALAVARLALGAPALEFVFFSGGDGPRNNLDLEWLEVDRLRIPVDGQGNVLIPYRGPEGSFPYVSAVDVLQGNAPNYPIQGSIVLVGASAAGLRDIRVTPVGQAYNGVEVHANIIAGILDQRLKHSPRYVLGIEVALLLSIALLMTGLMARARLTTAVLATALLVLAVASGNLELWRRADFVVPLAPALALVAALFFAHVLYGYFTESRSRRMLSTVFGQYVPPALVEEMARNAGRMRTGSEIREMTVLFTDVRAFTGIAEELAPQELSRLMNAFLTPMTRVIHRHRGTIDKYMGDAIMAFWGAPVEDPRHAHNALLAGLEMLGALQALGPDFREQGWPELSIGIGLNTGQMRVGNMGSEFRQAYTVMGDPVNLGARIEGLTRHYGVSIAAGEATVAAAPEFAFLELDRVRVKGKDAPAALYEPLGLASEIPAATRLMLNGYRRALEAYRARRWDDAEAAFFALHQQHHERKLFQLYLDRIAVCRSDPPDASWDGVFTHSSK